MLPRKGSSRPETPPSTAAQSRVTPMRGMRMDHNRQNQRPEQHRPDHNRPNPNRPEQHRPDHNRPDQNRRLPINDAESPRRDRPTATSLQNRLKGLKDRQQQRLASRPQSPGTRNAAHQARSQRTSPLVYLCRLLILGIGVGAIAGTVISIWDPTMRYPAEANHVPNSATAASQQSTQNRPESQPGTLATVSSVRMGRELTDLVGKITPLTRDLTDLVPGVFLIDLDNGDYFSFNGNTTFSAASMIKVPILVAFFQDVDAGKIKLDEKIAIQQADIAEGSGDMQYAGVGSEYTLLETATNMIVISDNTATNMIVRRLGGIEVLNRRFQQWGLQQTIMRKPLPDLEGTNTTSPKELVSLMALLNEGKLISMKSRDRAFEIMRRTVTDTLLPSVLAPGSTAAHKTGDIGSLVGDVGIIDLPTGRRYGVAMMVKRPHNDNRAQELIRQMAAVVYEHFGGQPVLVPSPIPPTVPNPQQTMPAAPATPGYTPGYAPTPGMQTPGMTQPTAPTDPTAIPQALPTAPAPQMAAPAQAAPEPVAPEATEPTESTDPEAQEPDPETEASNDGSDEATEEPADVTVLPDSIWRSGR